MPGMLQWYPLQMFAQKMQGKNTWFPAHNQTEPNPPEIIIVMSQHKYDPKHQGFCPKDAAKAFTSGCETHAVPITGQGVRACYFHQRIFSRGTFKLPARRNKPLEKT